MTVQEVEMLRKSHDVVGRTSSQTEKAGMALTFIFLVLITTMPASVLAYATEQDYLNLYNNLTSGYNRQLRPIANQSASLELSMFLTLLSLSGVDDVKQEIQAMIMISASWKDKNLVWNPDHYGGISLLHLTEEVIWAPTISLGEAQDDFSSVFQLPTQHEVFPDGTVEFTTVGELTTTCTLDMTYFPYDSQRCSYTFTMLDARLNEVRVVADSSGFQKSQTFAENGEWLVPKVGMDFIYFGPTMSAPSAWLLLERRPTYYTINVVTPPVFMAVLGVMTFVIPVESGERIGYSLTTLLAQSVYVTYIGGLMPRSSVNLPVLMRYLLGLFTISCVCVILTVAVVSLRWAKVTISADGRKFLPIFIWKLQINGSKRASWVHRMKRLWSSGKVGNDVEQREGKSPDNFQDRNAIIISDMESKLVKHKNEETETGNSFGQPVSSDSQGNVKESLNRDEASDAPDPDVSALCLWLDLASFVILASALLIMSFVCFIIMGTQ